MRSPNIVLIMLVWQLSIFVRLFCLFPRRHRCTNAPIYTQEVSPLSLSNTTRLKDPCSLLLHPSCWQKWIIPLSCSSGWVFSVFRKERRYFTLPGPVAVNVFNWRITHHLYFTAPLPGDTLYMQTCQNLPHTLISIYCVSL